MTDPYRVGASVVFSKEVDAVTSEERTRFKQALLAAMYTGDCSLIPALVAKALTAMAATSDVVTAFGIPLETFLDKVTERQAQIAGES